MKMGDAKEQFSKAFCHAISSVAGLNIGRWEVDDESVDMIIGRRGGNGTTRSPKLEIQLKCTSQDVVRRDGIHFQLKNKNYNDLREVDLHIPKILVVLVVPEDVQSWVIYDPCRSVTLYKHAWWTCLKGKPDLGAASPTIILPLENQFNHQSLTEIMDKIGNGDSICN